MKERTMMNEEDLNLVELDGLVQGSPVKAIKLNGFDGMEIYSVPTRGGDVLDAKINGESAMMINSRGHINGFEIDTYGLQIVNWVEGLTTCGMDNVGGPTKAYSGHGTFSHSPMTVQKYTRNSVIGTVQCINLVLGPVIKIQREITVSMEKRSFIVKDELSAGNISNSRPYLGDNDYMLLYHPNFPVENGDQLFANAKTAISRDLISNCNADSFAKIDMVGKGKMIFPPTQPVEENFIDVRFENFERCYVLDMIPNNNGDVYAAMISADGTNGSYINYNVKDFANPMAFTFWRNPRSGCVGLEIGSCFMGRDYCMKHDLMSKLMERETKKYKLEIGFLRGKNEVDSFINFTGIETADPKVVLAIPQDPKNGDYFHNKLFKTYQNSQKL